MTSVTNVRLAVAGVVGALVLTACGGGGSEDDSAPSPSPSASASSAETADTGGGTGGSASASGDLAGSWLATTDGKAVALVITGTEAGLFATGGTVCSGTAGEESGMRMIHLKCTDGSKDRATGMVDSVDGKTLKVTWEDGLGTETYTKAEGGQLPSGLPTASLG
ncbi:hypothetical protein QQY66_27700 [Streptomyces sp. DG2A-72]|uniref:hypothetical protein n=1 Tax=Streptomyces sp. DG2A-72 TaxID=3051386 RepID=UPI00265C82F5|nr:hypothetical protein [Streptomyces sp. DG2A-72]MDO0935267.1 hypothetical protein [Streptomyces sp. DG2A-72]